VIPRRGRALFRRFRREVRFNWGIAVSYLKESARFYHNCPGPGNRDACGGAASCYPLGADAQRWHVQANLKPRRSVGAFFGAKYRAAVDSSLIASNTIRTASHGAPCNAQDPELANSSGESASPAFKLWRNFGAVTPNLSSMRKCAIWRLTKVLSSINKSGILTVSRREPTTPYRWHGFTPAVSVVNKPAKDGTTKQRIVEPR